MDTTTYSTVPCYSLCLVKEKDLKYPVEKLSHSGEAVRALQVYLEDRDSEYLVVLMLDAANNMTGVATAAVGGITGLSCKVRDVFKHAIVGRAHAIILGHNHPSGDVNPSKEDVAFTEKVVEAGKILGVPVVDHVIISSGMRSASFSFQEHGMIP